jgi:hypothetical protein
MRLLPPLLVVAALLLFAGAVAGKPETSGAAQNVSGGQASGRENDIRLPNGALREAVRDLAAGGTPAKTVQTVGQMVRVEVVHSLSAPEARRLVSGMGGMLEGEVPGVLVQALVPWRRLADLEARDGVRYLQPPLEANAPIGPEAQATGGAQTTGSGSIIGEEVSKTNADAWHAQGITGAGVKIGIVDFFDGAAWSAAQSAGEVPPPAGTICRSNGSSCNIYGFGSPHGVAVAEIVHEMAPDAQIYLATALTTSDLQAVVDYFAARGVHIISRSLTSRFDGPGDGTGALNQVAAGAVSQGMLFVNAAGNTAGTGTQNFAGRYWRSPWLDANNNAFLDFAPGQEVLPFYCSFANGVRWNDWGPDRTDYDVYIFDTLDAAAAFNPKYSSLNDQGAGAPPLEMLDFACAPPQDGQADVDYMAIHIYHPGGGTAGDELEFMINLGGIYFWQNPHSASAPISDSANSGVLSIGAIDPATGTLIAPYSAWGPTNDNRTKPDISAAACVSSFTYSGCFAGTSSSAPAVSGAAALVRSAGLAATPSQLRTYLLNNATEDRGAPGTDNIYGKGELVLPAPPLLTTPTPSPTPTPTPTPVATATATPTAAATPTPAPTPADGTPTPTPTATPSPTQTPTPSPSPAPSPSPRFIASGDVDCDGAVNSVDALKILRHVAQMNVAQAPGCLPIGSTVTGEALPRVVGDVNCSGVVNSVDALLVLRYVIFQPVALPAGCPAIGS